MRDERASHNGPWEIHCDPRLRPLISNQFHDPPAPPAANFNLLAFPNRWKSI